MSEISATISASGGDSLREGEARFKWNEARSTAEVLADAYLKARRRFMSGGLPKNRCLGWQDEEDHLQEAALKIWSGVCEGSLSPESEDHFVNLLWKTSLHAYIDAWRKETRRGQIRLDSLCAFEPVSLEIQDEIVMPFDMGGILDHLSDEERRLLFMRAVLGLNWKEVSLQMGISEQAARTRFSRLRRRMAALIAESSGGEEVRFLGPGST
ncbi:MAG: sigma-70 family RNA polymerase sigma factor [Actinobacteria bacterium]|nr:sigma-70 family RNA polymerase sigma factor [Actinomycetota bacterium]